MQFSSFILAAIVAAVVSAQSATPTRSVTASRASNAPAFPTMSSNSTKPKASGTGSNNSSRTTNGPVKVSTAAAPGLLEKAGGVVAVAGMGVAFAVFL